LEHEIVPEFYNRGSDGLPRQWIQRMKQAIRLNAPQFSTQRMVQEYAKTEYFPISGYYDRMRADRGAPAQRLVDWQDRLLLHWYHIEIERVDVEPISSLPAPPDSEQVPQSRNGITAGSSSGAVPVLAIGDPVEVTARLHLGQLLASDIQVEVYRGPVDETGTLTDGVAEPLAFIEMEGARAIFRGKVHYDRSGLQGLAIRILPHHPDLHDPLEMRLIRWA
ncbi:MAG: alpha-glucan phosphorylase, partial [Synechococcus sp.]